MSINESSFYFPFGRRVALLMAATCWTGFGLMAVAISNGSALDIDTSGFLAVQSILMNNTDAPGWLMEVVLDITAMGGALLRTTIIGFTCMALIMRHFHRAAGLLFATVAGGWILSALLKLFFMRPRPDIVPHLTTTDMYSFPSGHTFNATVVYASLSLIVVPMILQVHARFAVVSCAIALSFLIGLSRIMLGVHFPSDVMAGWLGGAGWTFLAVGVLGKRTGRPKSRVI